MSIPSNRPSLNRSLRYGLAALLAPALVVGCGAAQGAVRTSSDGVSSSSPAPSTDGSPSPTFSGSDPESPSPSGSPSSGSARPSTTPSHSASRSASPSGAPSGAPSSSASTPGVPSPSPSADHSATPSPQPPPGVPVSIVHGTASGGRSVALTFDDGPGPATGQVLDLLAQYGAHATFCQIGPQATANPAIVHRILAEGHRLCDHTVHHPQPLHTLPHQQQVYEIDAAKDMIVQAGGAGTKVAWFRAPGGDFTAENRLIAAQDNLRPLGWTVDPRDWARPGVPAIVTAVQQQLKPGGIVLMHDGGGDRSQSVAALKQLLPWLIAQGYTFDFPAA
ncbi:polysaccharide deacetylase family protein [Kitasatospora sp. McL0602]|uniref:polysaccharide deacetylase family protein n=1 Tax=Kitasatospora sp. McL0602 TaxID=3439530 RepID=UPI003F897B88